MLDNTDLLGGETDSFYRRPQPETTVLEKPRATPAVTPKPENDLFLRPIYKCPELGRTCLRPGAYDAYDLPSLYNGVAKQKE